MRKGILLALIGLSAATAGAQTKKTITSQEQVWLGYFNQTRFTDRWGIWAEAQLRTQDDFFNKLNQSILRGGLTYYIYDKSKLTAGYAWVNNFPGEGHRDISQTEHRFWQQIQWHTNYPKVRTMQWVRLEERYRRKIANDSTLAEGYNFNYRIRYNLLLQVPLSPKGPVKNSFSFIVNDEVHINFGKNIVYNYFDQNRFFIGFAWHVNDHDNLQFGYMNVFQQLPAGNQYKNNHVARIFYFQNLDMRKKKP
jgi:Protein of unknown function (DUF2490)